MKVLLYSIPAALLLFTGCAQQKSEVYANFMMPPKEIKNINDVKNIKVDVSKIKINGLSKNANKDVANMIKGKLSSLVYKEQFLNVSDDILNKSLTSLEKNSKNSHGYSNFSTLKVKNSTLKVDVNINLKKTTGTQKVTTKLLTQHYREKRVGKKYPRPIGVKSGKPTISIVTNDVPFIKYVANADLNIKLYNVHNQVVYTKKFSNLELTKKLGGSSKSVVELPTDLSIVSELLTDKLREVVYDLSPHKESRKLVVNEKGDASVVALMKATAFSESAIRLDDVISKQETAIEKEKKELKVKYEESLKKAKDQKAKDKLTLSYEEKVKSLYKPLTADYENMGILTEIFGDLEDASNWYSQAVEADGANKIAKLSLQRVNKNFSKQKALKRMNGGKMDNKSSYKNKDNIKDR